MRIDIKVETEWHNVEWTCSHCGGHFKAKLTDFAKQRTVRCSGGHKLKLSEDGSVTKIQRSMDKFGR
jgi:hypothetical protein